MRKKFLIRKAYQQHKARVHPSDLFKCPLCKRKFKQKHCMEMQKKNERCKIDLKPWDQLTQMNAKRYRLNLVIQEITRSDAHTNKNRNACLYKSLIAMSEKEKDMFQDMLDDKLNTSREKTGKKPMTVEDVMIFSKGSMAGLGVSILWG